MVGGGWLCLPAALVPLLFLFFFSTHSPPSSTLTLLTAHWWLCDFVHGQLRACRGRETRTRVDLSHLAEFETPTVFDRAFYFHHSIFPRYPKIVKIIICILYIYKNVSTILISAIPICGFDYLVISFQNYRISIYIDNTRRF